MAPLPLLLAAALGSQVDPRYAINITIYHVNPVEQSPIPVNMDSGDAPGDLYFAMQSAILPIECANMSNSSNSSSFFPAFDCTNPEKVSPSLAVNKVHLEIDSRYTGYSACNLCTNGTDPVDSHHTCVPGDYICDCQSIWDPTVGECRPDRVGYRPINVSHHHSKYSCHAGVPDWLCWRFNLATKFGGTWYSTRKEGMCSDDAAGRCSWRVIGKPQRIPKNCSDNAVYSTIEQYNPGCFSQCPGAPQRNISSPCWVNCAMDTVLGPQARNSTTIAGMPTEKLVKVWDEVFDADSKWGCVQ